MCGERSGGATPGGWADGSSPRVRGTRRADACPFRRLRFIPACAGNAAEIAAAVVNSTVHPRVCGERSRVIGVIDIGAASSPRVRGTHIDGETPNDERRFIPACAGNAQASIGRYSDSAVHPRVCGERRIHPTEEGIRNGSSPRVRGTPEIGVRAPAVGRFIPACAGNAAP